ncbi:MAG: hypothetical protein HOP29_17700 [Phycisphaerales bacterium]|nr:hypothetical protein [Phycisphaerales bacterium]
MRCDRLIIGLLCAAAMSSTLLAQPPTSYNYGSNGNRTSATNLLRVTDARVESFEPRVGIMGDRVLIFGRNLPAGDSAGYAVHFNGAAATIVAIAPNAITVDVPVTASTGPLMVTFPDAHQTDLGDFHHSGVTVTPPEAGVFFGQVVQFNAAIIGTGMNVSWQVRSLASTTESPGSISTAGLYTAPSSNNAAEFPYLVTAINTQSGRRGYAVIRPACTTITALTGNQAIPGLILSGNERYCYDFEGEAGTSIDAVYYGLSTTARKLRIRGPDGFAIDSTGPGSPLRLDDFIPPEDGAYRIEVEAQLGSAGGFIFGFNDAGPPTPIEYNVPVDDSIAVIGQQNRYSFFGNAGTSVTVDYETPTVPVNQPDHMVRLELVRPSGTVAATVPSCGTTARLDNVLLNETGTWTVRVRSYESWPFCGYGVNVALLTGDYTLTVCPSNGTPIPIAYGETVNSAFATDCQIVNFEFAGLAGDVVSAFYVGPATTRRMRMFAPDGSQMGTTGQGVGVSLLDLELGENGTYRIAVEAADNFTVGPFAIALSRLGDAVPIAFNTPVDTSIAAIGEVDQYEFTGVAGATVTVDYETPTVPVSRPDHMVRLELVRPSGTVAATTPSCGTTARLDNVSLNETGTWTVRVRSYEFWPNCGYGADVALLTGDYTLTVCPSNGAPIPIAFGETASSAFATDCQIVNFDFAGLAGDVVSAFYVGPATTRRMRMFAPDGSQLGTTGQGIGVSLLDLVLGVNGTYRISVEAADNVTVGPFAIALSLLGDAVPIAFNTPVDTSIAAIGEVDQYEFTGVAGATVTVDYETPTVPVSRPDHVVRLELVRPSGTVAATVPSCGTTARLDNVSLNETGTWTVRVRSYEFWSSCGYGADVALLTGDYTLTVCPSNGAPIPIAYGETADSVFASDCQIVNFDFAGLAGDVVSAFYVGPATARRMRMFAPDGSQLGVTGQGVGVSLLDLVLGVNGTYRISVEAADNLTVGPFGIALSRLGDAIPIAFNTPVNTSIAAIGEVDQYEFAGVAGTPVTVDYVTPTVPVNRPDHMVRLELVRPSGAVASTVPSCGATARLNNVILNETGTWTVRVRSYEFWSSCGYGADVALLTGAYTLSVCSAGPCAQ